MTVNPQWLASFGSECFYCGKTLTPQTATDDHRIPKSRGGGEESANKVPACARCNYSKRDRTDVEFIASRKIFQQHQRFAHALVLLEDGFSVTNKNPVDVSEILRPLVTLKAMERRPPTRAELDRKRLEQKSALSHYLQIKSRNQSA